MAYTYYPYQQTQPYFAQQYQQQSNPQQPINGGIIWVNSEQEAMSYMVLPNTAVTLWNSNAPVVYLKQADASGKPTVRIYDLVERKANQPAQPTINPDEYVSVSDFNALVQRVDALAGKLSETKSKNKGD